MKTSMISQVVGPMVDGYGLLSEPQGLVIPRTDMAENLNGTDDSIKSGESG